MLGAHRNERMQSRQRSLERQISTDSFRSDPGENMTIQVNENIEKIVNPLHRIPRAQRQWWSVHRMYSSQAESCSPFTGDANVHEIYTWVCLPLHAIFCNSEPATPALLLTAASAPFLLLLTLADMHQNFGPLTISFYCCCKLLLLAGLA